MGGNTSGSGVHGTAKTKPFLVLSTACVKDHISRVLLFPPLALKRGKKKKKNVFFFLVCMYVYQRECIVTLRNQSVLLKLSLTSGSVSRISMDVDHVCESVLTVRNQPILPAKSDFWFCFQDQHGRGSWNSVAEGGDKAARNSRSVWGILVFATSDFVFCLEMSSSTLQDSYLSYFTAEYFWGNKNVLY